MLKLGLFILAIDAVLLVAVDSESPLRASMCRALSCLPSSCPPQHSACSSSCGAIRDEEKARRQRRRARRRRR